MTNDLHRGGPTTLSIALGSYPHTAALRSGGVTSDKLRLEFAALPNINRGFAPMVRENAFDVAELAIATFLLARLHKKPLVLLPVITAARFQQTALICRTGGPISSPADLRGRRLGVRSYSQTTAAWLRGILAEEFALNPRDLTWCTQEDSHLLEFRDPAFVQRLDSQRDLLELLRDGALDAVIVGNDFSPSPEFTTVFADVAAAVENFWRRHRFIPVNHFITVSRELADARPDLLHELMRMFTATPYTLTSFGHECAATGRAALAPSLRLMCRYMDLALSDLDIWEGLPGAIA